MKKIYTNLIQYLRKCYSNVAIMHPLSVPFCSCRVNVSIGHFARDKVHHRQVISPSQGNTEAYRTNNQAPLHTKRNKLSWQSYILHVRKVEYPERSDTCTGRTYKLHAERSKVSIWTQGLCCKATVIQTTLLCINHPIIINYHVKNLKAC